MPRAPLDSELQRARRRAILDPGTEASGLRIEVRGTVQGVGFRPWVYRVAHEVGVGGRVRNHARGVTVEAFGGPAALAALVARLREPPAPAHVRELTTAPIPAEAVADFVIERSEPGGARALSIPPDLATCVDCAREISDPDDRRYHYPFTNCTACGPRFTIATGVPYDRAATTMAPFAMCPACQREYDDVGDRRFHAQPNACPVCGPRLTLLEPDGQPVTTGEPLAIAASRLAAGAIVAIKGLGGFHLACDARRGDVVTLLRARKHRDHKPFAVMVSGLAAARALADIDADEAALLTAAERPIVLVHRRAGVTRGVALEVAPDTDWLGLMLPYTPLHHLLMAAVDRPLVMTSGNRADAPICAELDDALARLGGIADAFLVHDRDIATRCDDSVARVIAGKPTLLRRSRGWVPRPVTLARPVTQPVLAVGGQLKNTFCLAAGDCAYLGPHIGDLDNLAAQDFLTDAVARMQALLRITPTVIAYDAMPDGPSALWAERQVVPRRIAVQHHHAHVVSAMAEHGLEAPVIGVAFDGTGWGPDGTAWGGEILLADARRYRRLATLRPIALAGGDAAIHAPWRIALALCEDAFDGALPELVCHRFARIPPGEVAVVRQLLHARVNAPLARGLGRYFDGIAALVLRRPRAHYEAELAMAWTAVADPRERGRYPWAIDRAAAVPELDLRPMVRAVVADLAHGAPTATIAARFHETIVAATAAVVAEAAARLGGPTVVLTGGALANPRLAEGLVAGLAGLDVRRHGEVPPGDGGLALGQAVIADAQVRAGGVACA